MDKARKFIQAARLAHQAGGGTVLDVLLREPGLGRSQLEELLSRAGVALVLDGDPVDVVHSELDQVKARSLRVLPLHLPGRSGGPHYGLGDPWDDGAVEILSKALGRTPLLAAVPESLLDLHLGPRTSKPDQAVSARPTVRAVSGPVVEFVDSAIAAAYMRGASDVHFECTRTGINIKLRLDGVLVRFASMDGPARAEEVISRIKVLSQLDITERRKPQDGRLRVQLPEVVEAIDLRVSIMPSIHGEDAVLRLLDKAQLRGQHEQITLDLLGFDSEAATKIRELAGLPHGMLLITGPTGSGKTTTVYAALSEVHNDQEKIVTIEDPVEYELPGVLQIPVNERKGLTFAVGLRSILRHDPDRILVGEIRDAETAEIAVQSALTGHQVFTTVHANSIYDVMGRFRHFGLDMFGFMSSLNGVVVQRLIRRLCPSCKAERPPSATEHRWMASLGLDAASVGQAVGCAHCRATGYLRRSVIAEVHQLDDRLRDLVIDGGSVAELRQAVEANGPRTLQRQAADMAVAGQTTPEEVKRVVGIA